MPKRIENPIPPHLPLPLKILAIPCQIPRPCSRAQAFSAVGHRFQPAWLPSPHRPPPGTRLPAWKAFHLALQNPLQRRLPPPPPFYPATHPSPLPRWKSEQQWYPALPPLPTLRPAISLCIRVGNRIRRAWCWRHGAERGPAVCTGMPPRRTARDVAASLRGGRGGGSPQPPQLRRQRLRAALVAAALEAVVGQLLAALRQRGVLVCRGGAGVGGGAAWAGGCVGGLVGGSGGAGSLTLPSAQLPCTAWSPPHPAPKTKLSTSCKAGRKRGAPM